MANSWTVEYANQTRARVEQCLFEARLELPRLTTKVNLYVAPLSSYNVILGMNWLWEHEVKVDCFSKTVECLNDLGNKVYLQGIQHEVKVWQISDMQLKRSNRKGCQVFAVKMEEIGEFEEVVYQDNMMMYEMTSHKREEYMESGNH